MMKIFVSNHVVLFILVVTTTIDASRIFYLPLPKIHSSHDDPQPAKAIQEPAKTPISDETIPSSELEREEYEKRGDTFDWEALVDREAAGAAAAKRRIIVNELLPASLRHLVEENENDLPVLVNKPQLNHEDILEEQPIGEKTFQRAERLQSNAVVDKRKQANNAVFIFIVATCCAVGVVGLVGAAVFWYKIQKRAASAEDTDYPSYGVTGPNSTGGKISPSSTMSSDRKLAQSAQMFHYQQQRQQMMAQEKAHLDTKPVNSDDSDDEAPGGGDYTVYECPGLAPTGEMEVRNPLFAEPDSSLISSGATTTNNHYPQLSTSPPKEKSLP